MSWYVYILQSQVDGTYYKGSTEDPVKRLAAHNAGESKYTRSRVPWRLVYVEELPTKKDMLVREKKLKRGNAAYYTQLIQGDKNILERFL